ncbi:MAG: patatin-like phospholipase family protein, partial [Spirochaetota bacterium]|nr:patatin-like phospholipase family protein [Spirochaetota bacterium]
MKKIAYTLSGGAAYGYAHIGVLKYLEENNIRPAAIAGTSMGAIVGGLYAYGYDAEHIEQIAEHVRSLELVRLFFPSFPRGGIIDTDGIRDFFHGFIHDARIEELPIAFRSVAVDINTGEEIVFDRGRLIDAMIASMSIPAVFKPYHYQGRFLVDGGLVNNLPWDIAQKMGDVNIVVDVAPLADQPDPERVYTSDFLSAETEHEGAG